MPKIPVILDCDPGVDDAFAIVTAVLDPKIDLKLVTTVTGNVSVDRTTKNALYIMQDLKSKIPVSSGAARPLLRELEEYEPWFGESGLGNYPRGDLELSETDENAVAGMYKVLSNSKEAITIVGTGSYTNLALLLVEHPDIVGKIKQFILMGGTLSKGNMSSVAEFNIYCDPEAADLVYRSNIPIITAGIDVSQRALIYFDTNKKISKMSDIGLKLSTLVNDFSSKKENGFVVYDLNTIAYLLHPEFYTCKDYFVAIQKTGPARGATVADLSDRKDTNVKIMTNVNDDQLNTWLLEEMNSFK